MNAKTFAWVLAGVVGCTGPEAWAVVDGAEARPAVAGTAAPADLAFVRKAAISGMAEVELGKMAQQKGATDGVRDFGAQMVRDHTLANEQLKQIASLKQIDIPQTVDARHQKDLARFSKLNGADFDREYLSDMVADHRMDIAEFKRAAASAKDTDLREFASRTLPTLQSHLQMAQAATGAGKMPK